jgi:hypothetical protein
MSALRKKLAIPLVLLFAAGASLSLRAQDELAIAPQTVILGETEVIVPVRLTIHRRVYGYSLSLLTDPELLALKEVSIAGTSSEGADWSFGEVLDGGARLSWGVVLDTTEPIDRAILPVSPVRDQVLANVVIEVVARTAGETAIEFRDFPPDYSLDPPDPGSRNQLFIESGFLLPHLTTDGTITISGGGVGPFQRGDCDQDGSNTGQVTDGVFLLNYLFSGGEAPKCLAACDMNGDGSVPGAPTDAVVYFSFNFLGGTPLPEPLGECNSSSAPGDLALGCESPEACAGA